MEHKGGAALRNIRRKICGLLHFSRSRYIIICVVFIVIIVGGAVSAGDFYLLFVAALTCHLATPFKPATTHTVRNYTLLNIQSGPESII